MRVGAFHVEYVDNTPEITKHRLLENKSVPFMCGATAAILKYMQIHAAQCDIPGTVRILNTWMAGAGGSAYGVQTLIQAGRTLAARSGISTEIPPSAISNILQAAKVIVLGRMNWLSCLDCAANNPHAMGPTSLDCPTKVTVTIQGISCDADQPPHTAWCIHLASIPHSVCRTNAG